LKILIKGKKNGFRSLNEPFDSVSVEEFALQCYALPQNGLFFFKKKLK